MVVSESAVFEVIKETVKPAMQREGVLPCWRDGSGVLGFGLAAYLAKRLFEFRRHKWMVKALCIRHERIDGLLRSLESEQGHALLN